MPPGDRSETGLTNMAAAKVVAFSRRGLWQEQKQIRNDESVVAGAPRVGNKAGKPNVARIDAHRPPST